jgi:hypothetical protein
MYPHLNVAAPKTSAEPFAKPGVRLCQSAPHSKPSDIAREIGALPLLKGFLPFANAAYFLHWTAPCRFGYIRSTCNVEGRRSKLVWASWSEASAPVLTKEAPRVRSREDPKDVGRLPRFRFRLLRLSVAVSRDARHQRTRSTDCCKPLGPWRRALPRVRWSRSFRRALASTIDGAGILDERE